MNSKQDLIVEQYEEELREAEKYKQEQMSLKKTVILAKQNIPAGQELSADMFQLGELPADMTPKNIITSAEDVVGKITKININQNGTVVNSMIYEKGRVTPDLRVAEYNTIMLPTKLQKDDVIDVRINFPTGQDYTVLGKKTVYGLNVNGTVWLDVDEQEILTMSSAVIDAYLQDGIIYALTYKDPQIQEEPQINYPVNMEVLDLMLNDPNIILNAKQELSKQARTALEGDIAAMSDEERAMISRERARMNSEVPYDETYDAENSTAGMEQNETSTANSNLNDQNPAVEDDEFRDTEFTRYMSPIDPEKTPVESVDPSLENEIDEESVDE